MLGAFERIVLNEACLIVLYLGPDIYPIAYEHWTSDSERFHHCDAEVLRMRRKDKRIACSERTPFEVTVNETRPVYSAGNAKLLGHALKLRLRSHLVRTGNHEVHIRNRSLQPV